MFPFHSSIVELLPIGAFLTWWTAISITLAVIGDPAVLSVHFVFKPFISVILFFTSRLAAAFILRIIIILVVLTDHIWVISFLSYLTSTTVVSSHIGKHSTSIIRFIRYHVIKLCLMFYIKEQLRYSCRIYLHCYSCTGTHLSTPLKRPMCFCLDFLSVLLARPPRHLKLNTTGNQEKLTGPPWWVAAPLSWRGVSHIPFLQQEFIALCSFPFSYLTIQAFLYPHQMNVLSYVSWGSV